MDRIISTPEKLTSMLLDTITRTRGYRISEARYMLVTVRRPGQVHINMILTGDLLLASSKLPPRVSSTPSFAQPYPMSTM